MSETLRDLADKSVSGTVSRRDLSVALRTAAEEIELLVAWLSWARPRIQGMDFSALGGKFSASLKQIDTLLSKYR